ncbi:MAG: ribosome biogenesis GTP-binding protein YihA/YsxC [Acidobacteriia bacterium]|nr:ribosome biogenesis GTP-binding protein YihA/YsxC [Terriglobia bacterium]
MKQTRVEFIVSAFAQRDFPRAVIPEVVVAGRSNVGKSSLINRLTGEEGLARTSSTPGKTRSINFYRCDGSFFLVDLPGFGFAKGKAGSREWKQLVERYFERGPAVALVIHLVDARMPPTNLDIQFAEWLHHLGIPSLVVATKVDKLSGNQRAVELRAICGVFPEVPVIFSSAVTGVGCKEIWNRVVEATQNH